MGRGTVALDSWSLLGDRWGSPTPLGWGGVGMRDGHVAPVRPGLHFPGRRGSVRPVSAAPTVQEGQPGRSGHRAGSSAAARALRPAWPAPLSAVETIPLPDPGQPPLPIRRPEQLPSHVGEEGTR